MTDPYDDILKELEPLRAVPARSAEAARSGLRQFLDEAAQRRGSPVGAVSRAPGLRLTGWTSILKRFKLEGSPMLVLAKVMLLASLIFGGVGGTVLAAQGSLPGDALYPIKLFTEEVRIGVTADPQAQITLHLELAQTRTQEMAQLAVQQRAVPDSVPAQLQTHLQTALQQAARLNNGRAL